MINKKLTECEEIDFFCKILEDLNFFNNPDSIEKNIKEIGLIYSMNCLYDAGTNDMLASDVWDGDNFSKDAKLAIATYMLDKFKQDILTNGKEDDNNFSKYFADNGL